MYVVLSVFMEQVNKSQAHCMSRVVKSLPRSRSTLTEHIEAVNFPQR